MKAERLLAHYERIADSPDAIARLRRFILDLAVRGKLVPQDPQDEPAPVRDGRLNAIDQKFVDQKTYEIWSARCRPEPGDILITREAPMGEVCRIGTRREPRNPGRNSWH